MHPSTGWLLPQYVPQSTNKIVRLFWADLHFNSFHEIIVVMPVPYEEYLHLLPSVLKDKNVTLGYS